MSSEAKRVKIFTLLALFAGLALIVYGVVRLIGGNSSTDSYVICGEGVLTLVFGARGALIANVPARLGKLATFAFVVFLVQLVCVAGAVLLIQPENVANDPVPVCACAVPAVISLVIALLSRGIAKRAER